MAHQQDAMDQVTRMIAALWRGERVATQVEAMREAIATQQQATTLEGRERWKRARGRR